MLLGLLTCCWFLPPVWAAALLMIPMIADGVIQLKTAYESTNPRRLATGLLFGYGLAALFAISTAAALQLGCRIGQSFQ